MNALNHYDGFAYLLLLVALYFLPAIVAYRKKRKNTQAITLLNLFLGWTFLGWIGALIWAVSEDK